MTLAPMISSWLLQAGTLPDTIVTMPVRSWYDYTNGVLQLLMLILAVVVLAALVAVLLKVNKAIDSAKGMVEKLHDDVRPILAQASQISGDAREVVAMLKTDADRVTHAVGKVSERLLDVATAMENRIDEVSAVIDVVQDELEETALTATAAMRGARLGGRALAGGLSKAIMGAVSKPSGRSRRAARDVDEDGRDRPRTRDFDQDYERPRNGRNRDSESERRYRENG